MNVDLFVVVFRSHGHDNFILRQIDETVCVLMREAAAISGEQLNARPFLEVCRIAGMNSENLIGDVCV